MRQKWRPLVKSSVVLRGNQYTGTDFIKNIIDSPFRFVKKIVFHVVDASIFQKGTLMLLKI